MSEPIEPPAVSSGDCPLLEGGPHNLLASRLQPSEGVQALATRDCGSARRSCDLLDRRPKGFPKLLIDLRQRLSCCLDFIVVGDEPMDHAVVPADLHRDSAASQLLAVRLALVAKRIVLGGDDERAWQPRVVLSTERRH